MAAATVIAALIAVVGAPSSASASAGGLDPTFGTSGIVSIPFSGESDAPRDLLVDSQHRIMLTSSERKEAGSGISGSVYYDYRAEIARLGPGGGLDAGFAGDGIREMGQYDYEGSGAGPSALSPSGVLLTIQDDSIVALDPGGGVLWQEPFGPQNPERQSLGVDSVFAQSSGAFLLAGSQSTYNPNGPDNDTGWLSYREPDGDPDPSHGPGGVQTFPLPDDDAYHLQYFLRRPSGEVVVMARAFIPDFGSVLEIRQLRPDGTPDAGFGDGGAMTYGFPNLLFDVSAATIDADGRLLVGVAGDGFDGPSYRFIDRILPNGELDPSFGHRGRLTMRRVVAELLPLPGGRVVEVDSGYYGTEIRLMEQDGTLDQSFGGGDGFASTPALAAEIATLDGKRVLVAGTHTVRGPEKYSSPFYKAEVAAFRLDDPGDDADLDGLADSEDRCPESRSRRADGCPLAHRKFNFYISNGDYSFDLEDYPFPKIPYACQVINRIRVVRLTEDGPRTVFRGVPRRPNFYYPPDGPPKSGRYRAIIPGFNDNGKARCATQRSAVIKVRDGVQVY